MPSPTRRKFLTSSAAATAGGVLLSAATPVHAAGSDTLKVGLVGSGGRGSGAAVNALVGDANCKLVALCDIFPDRIEGGLKAITQAAADEEKQRKRTDIVNRIDVKPEMKFDGFDGYKKLIDSGVDVVLLCSTPGFRPLHLAYAVEKKKDIFMEKPHATDAAGLKSVLDSVRKQKENGKSLVSGFTYRYHAPKREMMKRIHGGEIGDIRTVYSTYLTSELWHRGNSPKWSQMEQQIRNWYYYIWLSGDFIVEQNIHTIDKAAWLMGGQLPVAATGLGGRQSRTDEKYGNIWDNFSVTFEYESGARVFNQCRQVSGCHNEVNDIAYGTKGTCDLMRHTLTAADGKVWKPDNANTPLSDAYQTEHNELFAAIRKGQPINDGEVSAYSTLMAILGREAAYTGKRITWKQLLASGQNLMPAKFEFGNLEVPPVPVPGQYKLGNGKA